MRSINLVPPERLTRREIRRRSRLWAWRLGVTVLLLGAAHVALARFAAGRVDEARRLAEEYASLKERFRQTEQLIRESEGRDERREAIRRLREDRASTSLITLLADALPAGSRLDFLSFGRSKSGAGSLTLRGGASDHEEVGEILGRLTASNAFEEVRLVSVVDSRDPTGGKPLSFEVQCAPKKDPAP